MCVHVGKCAWCGTVEEFLKFDRGTFLGQMKTTNDRVSAYEVGQANYRAWRDEFKWLRGQFARLKGPYRQLHLAFEYVLPGWPDKSGGAITYEKRPDLVMFSQDQLLVFEFKQREAPPFAGFARETRSCLRLFEKWHRRVPKMSAKGALVLTKAVDFGKRYPRVKAISPDRMPSIVHKTFAAHLAPCPDPEAWLVDLRGIRD